MAKQFAPRVSKKKRKTIDLSDKFDPSLFKLSDEKLLKGALLDELKLADITVKDQVRTKFNDSSIKELAENIKANGLIQPLVVHRAGKKFTLICGERRFRAMTSIKMEKAPCFILTNKSSEELMAIQFSENSSREALHYIDKADGILNYQKATKASERQITQALGISKSEVHRSLILAKLPKKIKEAAKLFDIEKYVLLEFKEIKERALKISVERKILAGELSKRVQLKGLLGPASRTASKKKVAKKKVSKVKPKDIQLPEGMSAEDLIKAMASKSKRNKIDKATKDMLKGLLD